MAAQDEGNGEHQLRTIIFGGEALELHILEPWIARNDPERIHLANMYGITETTVHVTYRRIAAADVSSKLGSVIGRPIPDLSFYILDKHGRPVPPLVTGEIFVGGAGVARGYLNRPELTAERFVSVRNAAGKIERLYKTGDLARLLTNGEVEYLGRNDFQVKVRGFRIELGEIEETIRKQIGVRDVVVIARSDEGGDRRLVAYVVPANPGRITAAELRRSVAKELPAHMVPSAFVELQSLPLTTNGKLDRNALPAPSLVSLASRDYTEPQGDTEKLIARVWQQRLGVERVGREDHFFELGGHSMLAVRVTAEINEILETELALRDLFSAPTVRELSQKAEERRGRTSHSNLAPIRSLGLELPLFLIHPVEGEVGYARSIARWLDSTIPVYGVAATGLLKGETPLETVSEMAERYMAAIREVQPKGPYRLAGWSAGGTIAYAMAERLRLMGEEIAFLGLIDTIYDYSLLSPAASSEVLKFDGVDEDTAIRFKNVRDATFSAVASYTPGRIDVPVDLYTASEPSRGDQSLGWSEFLGECLFALSIGGTHYTIIDDPHVRVLGRAMSDRLTKRQEI